MKTIVNPSHVARILAAIVVVIAAGFWALVSLFSDFSGQWSYMTWILYILAGHALAGLIVGTLLPLQWRFSVAAAWGVILASIAGIVGMLRPGEIGNSPSVPLRSRIFLSIVMLVLVPALVALGGFAGSRLANARGSERIR